MAQRSLHISTINPLAAQSANLTDVDRRALERIHFEAGDWDQLDWFVSRLSRLDLEKASEGDIVPLQEEWIALQRACFRYGTLPAPTRAHIARLQAEVRRHLEELAEKGHTKFDGKEFYTPTWVVYPKVVFAVFPQGGKETMPVQLNLPDRITWDTPPFGELALLVLFKHLVARGAMPGIIQRCPHCHEIFLQSRKNQKHCTRTCQVRALSQVITKKKNDQAKTNKVIKKMKQKGRSASVKGGKHHGKK